MPPQTTKSNLNNLSLVLKVLANAKLPDALRSQPRGLMQYIEFAQSCRPDKAFTPHPA
ncbi:hypothetical protein ACNKHW_16400 [Shigella flexneri]